MTQLLRVNAKIELEPLVLAEIEGRLYVIDGHHRLRAYKRAKREALPAHIKRMSWHEASHASKLANLTGTKMEMRLAQKRNALWHHLAHMADFGKKGLQKEVRIKPTAGQFGVNPETLRSMLRRLPGVNPDEYPAEQCDEITGWPHWKAVASVNGDMFRAMTEESREAHKARKVAEALVKLWERWGTQAMIQGAGLLISEAKDLETLSEAAEIAGHVAQAITEAEPTDF